jgi:Zn-dependent oligopeptidase
VPPLRAAAEREVARLGERAERDGIIGPVEAWDWTYCDNLQSREEHGVDQNEVSQYLPLGPVIEGMLALTAEMFGLEYRQVADAQAWHPDVTLYEIRDRASGELIAHFYADLHPREGKFYHAAAFPLVIGHRNADGSYATPVSAIVANLTPPGPDRPSLLRHGPHGELETLFHEFGHILHESLSRAEFTRFSGAETERDFVEAPSQIMEHWTWRPEVLNRFARHHATGEPIPAALLERMIGSRYLNVGLRGAWQVSFGAEDMTMHASHGSVDIEAAMRDAFAVTSLPYPEGTCSVASFGHLMGGYDAGYYGYLWAEVIGDDLWGRFIAEGITSPAVGMAYRRAILEPNGTRSGDELVADFLGRPASVANYLRMRDLA